MGRGIRRDVCGDAWMVEMQTHGLAIAAAFSAGVASDMVGSSYYRVASGAGWSEKVGKRRGE